MTRLCVWTVAIALATCPVVIFVLNAMGLVTPESKLELRARYLTWLWLAPLVLAAVLLSRVSAVGIIVLASLLCYREYARATGTFRWRWTSVIVTGAVLAMAFASLDHWYGLFVAITPLSIVLLASASVLEDRPSGFIQRTALASFGLMLFGTGLMHLAYMTNDPMYRPLLCVLLLVTQGGDVVAYCVGKRFGRRHLFPNTSPRKTLAGHVGALLFTGPLLAFAIHSIYPGTSIDHPLALVTLALIAGLSAQLGDLVLGSIKRDLGVKDLAGTLRGHGGVTDRCNSLLLAAPASFHFIGAFVGFGLEVPMRWITGP